MVQFLGVGGDIVELCVCDIADGEGVLVVVCAPKGERAFGQALGERAYANIICAAQAEHWEEGRIGSAGAGAWGA